MAPVSTQILDSSLDSHLSLPTLIIPNTNGHCCGLLQCTISKECNLLHISTLPRDLLDFPQCWIDV